MLKSHNMENKTEKDKETADVLSQENFMRLMLLVNKSAVSTLREMFCKKWKSIKGTEWKNTVETGSEFINGSGKSVYKDSRPIQRKILESGNISEWDLPLLIQSIKCLDAKGEETSILLNDETMSRCKRNKYFDTLKEIRNKLAHAGNVEMDSEKFEEMWKSVSDVLISFGLSQSELDTAKVSPLQEEKSSKKDSSINEENAKRAKELKDKGNDMYAKGNYSKAIELYTNAIHQTGIPSVDLSVLYSNRSITFVKMKKFESAKDDAKGAIHLRPTWWKGYFRLGCAYKELKSYNRALKNFDLALVSKPPASEIAKITEERDHCRLIINKLKRNEHLDPMNHAESFSEIAEEINKKYGGSFNAKEMQHSQKINLSMDLPIGLCGEGHNHRFGRGVPINYELAAKFYAKAASKGNAEGMFNLAEMTIDGQGVQRNIAEGIKLLEQAASQPLSMDVMGKKFPNIGVVESEHALGLKYDEGVGVAQNFEKALYWYTRATKHGSAPSANNIAIMYSYGKGVAQNLNTTIDYWKLAASRKLVRAMDNLAITYLQLYDVINARNWFMFGMKNGSLELKMRENEFKILLREDDLKYFEEDMFALGLLEEVKNGPLKHLILDNLPSFDLPADMPKDFGKASACAESSTSRELNDLEDPYRTFIIKDHRQSIKEMMKRGEKSKWEANPAKLLPKTPLDLIGLKPIFFQDMDPAKDHIYEGVVIKLTLIEDATLGKPAIGQIGEDEHGDAQRIFIYNFAQDKETQASLGFGCKISIVNPYFRLAMDGKPAIRVDDTSLLFLHSNLTDKNRCRYCGKEKCSVVPCRKCRRSSYCSKKCLLQDAKLLDHGLVCFKRM